MDSNDFREGGFPKSESRENPLGTRLLLLDDVSSTRNGGCGRGLFGEVVGVVIDRNVPKIDLGAVGV